jgi:uncharacterized protein YpmB
MRKLLSIAAVILAFFLIMALWLYLSAKGGFDLAEKAAIELALQESSLTEVDHVEFFAGAAEYTVVFGNNIDGEKLLVWVGNNDIHEEKASNGVSKSAIRKLVFERNGNVMSIRITPGKLNELWVWEVFYKKKESNGIRHYYDYYQFNDGNWLDTYKLSLED